MGKPILYGTHLSPPVRSVLLVAKAIGLELEFREVNILTLENRKPEFVEKNPQRTVPTLEDDGNIIWDSHAIVAYLVGKYAKDDALYPKDLYKRAVVDQRLHFDTGILFVRLRSILVPILFLRRPEIPQKKLDALSEGYAFIDKFLAKDPYLSGATLTVADLCCIATISSSQTVLPVDPEKYPNLTAWIKRMESLPFYEEVNGQYVKKLAALINLKIQEASKDGEN